MCEIKKPLFVQVKKREIQEEDDTKIDKIDILSYPKQNINISDIVITKMQPRLHFDQKSIEQLAKTIKEHGALQPIVVEYDANHKKYNLISGERRVRANQFLGNEQICAIVLDSNIKKETILVSSLIENIQREELSPIELAIAYKQIQDIGSTKKTYKEIAEIIGKTEAHVKLIMPINKLSQKIIYFLKGNSNFKADAKWLSLLASVENDKDQENLFTEIFEKKLNRSAALALIREFKKPSVKAKKEYINLKISKKKIKVDIDIDKIPSSLKDKIEELKKLLLLIQKP